MGDEKKITILVTGACGVTSRSVVRAIAMSRLYQGRCIFIGTDICQSEYALYEGLYDKLYRVPKFDEPSYRLAMEKILRENDVDYAICIPELEVRYWSEHPFDVSFFRIPASFCKIALSKRRLYEMLSDTGLVPKFQIIESSSLESSSIELDYPFWMRSYDEGSTSGTGALKVSDFNELQAWATINKNVASFMLSEFLPGRNLACFLMYIDGQPTKYAVVERKEYVMAKVAPSGITGNTSKGQLLSYPEAAGIAKRAVEECCKGALEPMNGLITVDLKEAANGRPMVTEINLRPVAFVSTMASAGLNFMEYELLHLEGRDLEISPEATINPLPHNMMFRDIDGLPVYLPEYSELRIGECIERGK